MRLLKEAGQARFSRITISKKSRLPKGGSKTEILNFKSEIPRRVGITKHKDKILFDVS